MIYQAIRYERPAGKYVLAALMPFFFIGYYVDRYRKRNRAAPPRAQRQ